MQQADRPVSEDFLQRMSAAAVAQPMIPDDGMFKHFRDLIDTSTIDPRIRKDFWGFSDKEAVISNMKPDVIIDVLRDWDITTLWWFMSHPERDLSFERMALIEQARAHLRQRLHRSLDGFERRLEATEIKEVSLNRPFGQDAGGQNALSKFFGVFKRGGQQR